VRFGAEPSLALGGQSVYYGTVDATPLFVVLLGELRRWGLDQDELDRLLPHADRALEWIVDRGDRDGDLFVEYQRATDRGLANQGWKDSWDGVTFADGTVARGPIALCEVQGYAYAAFLARAGLAAEKGDNATFDLWTDRAARLKEGVQLSVLAARAGLFRARAGRRKASGGLAGLQHGPLPVEWHR
jgi:glycogen debranching enzyme